jgi:tyrosine-specific transport protein
VQNNKEKENIGLLSMVKETLGPTAAVGSGIVYVFIHYALLVAYVAEAGDVLTSSFSLPTWTGMLIQVILKLS